MSSAFHFVTGEARSLPMVLGWTLEMQASSTRLFSPLMASRAA